MTTLALGKRPTDPNRPVLRMSKFLKDSAYSAPATINYAQNVNRWLLGANDQYGTCGPTAVANMVLLVSSLLADAPVVFTDEEIFDLYRRSGNPNFDPKTDADDNGVDMTVMLTELTKGGIGFGDRNVKALAFGSINPHSEAQLWAAGALFGGVLWGADLDVAQQTQFAKGGPWNFSARSKAWGGHAIFAAPSYVDAAGTLADRTTLVTWAKPIQATDTFIEAQVEEAYVVIFPWHLATKGFVDNVDLQGLAAEFKILTGRDFPGAPTPAPAPAPAPKPTPSPTKTGSDVAQAYQRVESLTAQLAQAEAALKKLLGL